MIGAVPLLPRARPEFRPHIPPVPGRSHFNGSMCGEREVDPEHGRILRATPTEAGLALLHLSDGSAPDADAP
jgi:hypothetical protein